MFEERNPFDISRRSGPEVAAEIAKRMVAWKQARARSYGTTVAAPGAAKPSAGAPPIAAPVQPARLPAPQSAPPTPRAPLFAAFAAARSATPAAASLKQAAPLSQASSEPARQSPALDAAETATHAPREGQPRATLETTALAPQSACDALVPPLEMQERGSAASAPAAEGTAGEAPAAATEPGTPAMPEGDVNDAATPAAELPAVGADQMESEEFARHRTEARAIKARWMAAHDPDTLLRDGSADTTGTGATTPEVHFDATDAAAPAIEQPGRSGSATTGPETPRDGEPGRLDTPGSRPLPAISIEAFDAVAGRKEPTFDAPARPQAAAIAGSAAAKTATAAQPGSVAALDEMSGRREPTLASTESGAPAAAPGASAEPAAVTAATSIDALDQAAGRKEPTFDEPAQRAAAAIGVHDKKAAGRTVDGRAAWAAHHDLGSDAPSVRELVVEAAGPARSHRAADGQAAGRRIEPRAIETRIEARRLDVLRADPRIAGRRPVLPRIEPEAWDVPPAVATRAERRHRGSAWAIALGAALLIVGITAPAAIWQGRQGSPENQVASVDPAPAQPATPATPPQDAPAVSPPETQPAEQPQDSTVRPQVSVAAREPAPAAATDTAAPARQAALSPVGDGGEVSEAPVVAPPPPALLESATGQPAARAPVGQVNTSPMVARPFVPDPVMNPPTAGAASIAVNGATSAAVNGAALPASQAAAGPKPQLIGQLKPKVAGKPASGGQQQIARKPRPFFQQSPEQMFDTLMDALTSGQPVNPANKPSSPSTRK
jgi:hypothetical protein